jgi:paired amphipathic helix protein Sin3a
VSHPTWASEDNSGFQSHKKNVYEEALHKCEEERHEFDFHLEIMSKTISALENINMKIQQMTNEEKATFKLKPGLGLPNKSIYQRIIKKVYGKEPGMEVIATLHDCPAIAVPIVLQRLKAKDEDWRRAQREWNKVWREVDARNFYKSLDHQGVTFKSTDKKAMTTKSLVASIEAARDEQLSERAALMDPSLARTKPSHQLAYEITDVVVMKDATKLVLSYLDRLGALYGSSERDKIEKWIIDFLITFFGLDKADFEDGLKEVNPSHDVTDAGALGVSNMVPVNAAVTAAMEVDAEEAESSQGGQTSAKSKPAMETITDLRKGLLTKSAAGSRMQSAKPSPHVPPSDLPAVKDDNTMPVDSVWIATQLEPQAPVSDMRSTGNSEKRFASERKATFFGNTITYVVLRIFQVSAIYLAQNVY